VSLPRLRITVHAGASHQALGRGRPHDAVEPHAAVPPASPLGSRGWLSGRAAGQRRARVPAAGWPATR
jgi:hypothetical protein